MLLTHKFGAVASLILIPREQRAEGPCPATFYNVVEICIARGKCFYMTLNKLLNRAKIYLWVIIMYIFLVPVTLVSAWAKTALSEKLRFDCFCGCFGNQEIIPEINFDYRGILL